MTRLSKLSCLVAFLAITLLASVSLAQPGLERAMEVKRNRTPELFELDGIVATGIGVDSDGNAIIKIYTVDDKRRGIPAFLDGVKVKKSVSGIIRAGAPALPRKKGGNGNGNGGGGGDLTDPQARQARPVPIGVSIGTYRTTNSNLCFAGTLGCRLKRFDLATGEVSYFILSNNHVIANENDATVEDDLIIQPGTLDNDCVLDPADVIGALADFEPIRFNGQANFVDAAIAATSENDTDFASPADAYGAPTSTTTLATVGLPVQKFGRTTGLTTGEVDSINATVNVAYDNGTATFVDQIIIVGKVRRGKKFVNGPFSDGGDSGSLIVTQDGNNPTGLLFAGNSSVTIANPIDTVLDTFSDDNNGILYMVDDGN